MPKCISEKMHCWYEYQGSLLGAECITQVHRQQVARTQKETSKMNAASQNRKPKSTDKIHRPQHKQTSSAKCTFYWIIFLTFYFNLKFQYKLF